MPAFQYVTVERSDAVAVVTLNRPEKRNALNPAMNLEMLDVLAQVEADPETRVMVLTGAGTAFCAGMDLKEYFNDVTDQEYQRAINRRVTNEWCDRALRMLRKPTIAMINGFCFGGAFTIVASCDFAISADEAQFGLSEVNWGGLPGGMVAKVISTLMPYREALYYAMTAERFDGKRAAEVHLVNRSVPAADLHTEVMRLAERLAGLDPAALRGTKEAFKQAIDMSYEQAYWFLMAKSDELRWQHASAGSGGDGIERFVSKEYRPGMASFTQTEGSPASPEPPR